MDDTQAIHRGQRAKQILEDDVFKDAFLAIEQEIFTQIKNCPVRDTEGLQQLRLMLGLLTKIQGCLISTMNNGKIAELHTDKPTVMKRIFG